MKIEPGSTLHLSTDRGQDVAYTVTAVRHYPIDFAELQPCLGGPRRTVQLSWLSQLPHADRQP